MKDLKWVLASSYTFSDHYTMQVFKSDRPECLKEVKILNGTEETTWYNTKKGLVTNFENVFTDSL